MGLFKLANTFEQPSASQSGFATPGAGEQTTGDPLVPEGGFTFGDPVRPTKGFRSWFRPQAPTGGQQGFPAPEAPGQARPPGAMPNDPPIFGGVYQKYTPYYDRGAAAFVPNFGYVLTNPIGAGVVALQRPQASYGPAAQYENGAIWWTSQVIPTSINLQGLTSPDELSGILDSLQVQAVVRTTG